MRDHGTNTRFVHDECRCGECHAAHIAYERGRRARIEPAYVHAAPAREHVLWLKQQGMGPKTIAKASGVPHGSISKLLYGNHNGRPPSKRIRRETADRLLAVTPADAADACKIDAVPTWRLLDEMIAAGAPKSEIARALGVKGPGLQIRRDKVRASTARTVADLHRRWLTGDVALVRRDRWGNETPVAPPRRDPPTAVEQRDRWDDIEPLYTELAEIIEERHAQPWRAEAACRGRPVWMWFPGRGDRDTLDRALRVCRSCLVRDQCRAANIDQPVGVYGALTGFARRELRKEGEAA